MAVLLQIKNAHKSYGDQVLLDGAEATLIDDVKVGFVGRNGAGKSTLLRILLGEEELDRGEIIRHPKLQLGYLRQHDPFLPGETAWEFLQRVSGQPDWKCGEVAGEFELKGERLTGPIANLSGGWQTRLKLAELLLHEPNLLLLDEPTNFLDLRTQILLEHFLRRHNGACLVVSHDRAFLSVDLHADARSFARQADACSRERSTPFWNTSANAASMRAHQRRSAGQAAASGRVHRQKQSSGQHGISGAIEKQAAGTLGTNGNRRRRTDRRPFALRRSSRAKARRCAAAIWRSVIPSGKWPPDIDLEIDHGSRAAIVGDNGQGKTTFLRTLVDSLPPLSGEVRWGYGCQVGIYAQHVYTSLPEDQTVLEYLEYCAARGTTKAANSRSGRRGAVSRRAGEQKNRVLSGGERARLCLAGLLLGQYNVLVLDEPGNHLDVDTVEALAEALVEISRHGYFHQPRSTFS